MTPHRYRCRRCQQVWARRGDVPSCCPGCHTHDQTLFLDITAGDTQMTRLRGANYPSSLEAGVGEGTWSTGSTENIRVLGQDWNANVMRWQIERNWGLVGTDRDLAEYDSWLSGKLDILGQVMSACESYGMKVIIDLHTPPGGRYSNYGMAIFYEEEYQNHWITTLESIARRFKSHPALCGYGMMNEPSQVGTPPAGVMNLYDASSAAASAIRAIDPAGLIFFSPHLSRSSEYIGISPLPVSGVIYELHVYSPHAFTHQGTGSYADGVTYPGVITDTVYRSGYWDKSTLQGFLRPARDFQLENGARMYVGEFGAVRWGDSALQYMRDCIEIFEEWNWDWTYHIFRQWGTDWSVDHNTTKGDETFQTTTERKTLVRSYFGKNRDPYA